MIRFKKDLIERRMQRMRAKREENSYVETHENVFSQWIKILVFQTRFGRESLGGVTNKHV